MDRQLARYALAKTQHNGHQLFPGPITLHKIDSKHQNQRQFALDVKSIRKLVLCVRKLAWPLMFLKNSDHTSNGKLNKRPKSTRHRNKPGQLQQQYHIASTSWPREQAMPPRPWHRRACKSGRRGPEEVQLKHNAITVTSTPPTNESKTSCYLLRQPGLWQRCQFYTVVETTIYPYEPQI